MRSSTSFSKPASSRRTLGRKAGAFLHLPLRDQATLAEAALLLTAVRASLALLGFKRTRDWAGRLPRLGRATADDAAQRCAELLAIGARQLPFRSSCLVQSVALLALLRLHGFDDATLRLGATRKDAAVLDAHAWIERRGAVLNDAPDVALRYPPFTLS